MTENIFEVAAKERFRFPFKGMVTVEDLYDLGLEDLDSIFKTLNKQLKQVQEESLLNTKTKEDRELDAKIAIVKHIVNTKLEEQAQRLKARELRARKQELMKILSMKQNEELLSKSASEIRQMIEELE